MLQEVYTPLVLDSVDSAVDIKIGWNALAFIVATQGNATIWISCYITCIQFIDIC